MILGATTVLTILLNEKFDEAIKGHANLKMHIYGLIHASFNGHESVCRRHVHYV